MQKLMTFAATWATLFMLSLWTPADAATVQQQHISKPATVATTTDMSARRYYRRYWRGGYRPYYYGGYYGPRPYYGYGYYRPYYRPYYAPAPFPFFGFPFF